jgi:hypothetical protein
MKARVQDTHIYVRRLNGRIRAIPAKRSKCASGGRYLDMRMSLDDVSRAIIRPSPEYHGSNMDLGAARAFPKGMVSLMHVCFC